MPVSFLASNCGSSGARLMRNRREFPAPCSLDQPKVGDDDEVDVGVKGLERQGDDTEVAGFPASAAAGRNRPSNCRRGSFLAANGVLSQLLKLVGLLGPKIQEQRSLQLKRVLVTPRESRNNGREI